MEILIKRANILLTMTVVKIKTLLEKLQEGPEKAFESLDKKVDELGEIEIQDIKDSVYPAGSGLDASYVERIVLYKEKDTVKGEPWQPTLDTNVEEFVAAVRPSNRAEDMALEAYARGKTTIRELIAMPYGWFESMYRECKSRGPEKSWNELKKTLGKYDIKLYKRGNVIED